jgi:two-component system sensor histidine kinase ChiS
MTDKQQMIILVDDDADFREINKNFLEAKSYKVVEFSNPQSALDYMAKEKPDLVITDLMMTNINSGFTFSKEIKNDPRFADTPVIIITAISSRQGFDFAPRGVEELKAMCADAYFDKPIMPEVLLAKVEELLEK